MRKLNEPSFFLILLFGVYAIQHYSKRGDQLTVFIVAVLLLLFAIAHVMMKLKVLSVKENTKRGKLKTM
jgi:uncharacterized integral membrane protein